jgi:hypothetical protein
MCYMCYKTAKHRTVYISFKKNENIQFGQIYIGDIFFTYKFLEDQKLKQERSSEVLKKKISFVRSYPLCPILSRFTVLKKGKL